MQTVTDLFAKEDFASLDKMADELWRTHARMPDGLWKLSLFYGAMNVAPDQGGTNNWDDYFARIGRWEKHFPASATARIVHARALTSYAWDARGTGSADTVTAQGKQLFAERLAQARAVLDSDPALRAWPGYYQMMIELALDQGWARAEYERLFAAAAQLAPDYETFYFLEAKWHGAVGIGWHHFALNIAKATEAQYGQAFYARIVWAAIAATPSNLPTFQASLVDWPRMRTGFHDLARQYPNSLWNENAFCFYAWAARDRPTARQLFDDLKGRYAPDIWQSAENFQLAEAWAQSEKPAL